MITTILFCVLAFEAVALSASLGLCQAARQGDEDLARDAIRTGQPEVAAIYLQGAPA